MIREYAWKDSWFHLKAVETRGIVFPAIFWSSVRKLKLLCLLYLVNERDFKNMFFNRTLTKGFNSLLFTPRKRFFKRFCDSVSFNVMLTDFLTV